MGDVPTFFLKTVLKWLTLEKPHKKQTSVTLFSWDSNISLTFLIL